jgi:hypothetical protein
MAAQACCAMLDIEGGVPISDGFVTGKTDRVDYIITSKDTAIMSYQILSYRAVAYLH